MSERSDEFRNQIDAFTACADAEVALIRAQGESLVKCQEAALLAVKVAKGKVEVRAVYTKLKELRTKLSLLNVRRRKADRECQLVKQKLPSLMNLYDTSILSPNGLTRAKNAYRFFCMRASLVAKKVIRGLEEFSLEAVDVLVEDARIEAELLDAHRVELEAVDYDEGADSV